LKDRELGITPDEWRTPNGLSRFKPAYAAASKRTPNMDRSRMTFDFLPTQVRKFKQSPDQPSSA